MEIRLDAPTYKALLMFLQAGNYPVTYQGGKLDKMEITLPVTFQEMPEGYSVFPVVSPDGEVSS